MKLFGRNQKEPAVKTESKGFRLFSLLSSSSLSDAFYEELEDLMVEGDMGVRLAVEITDELKSRLKNEKTRDEATARRLLRSILKESLIEDTSEPDPNVLNIDLILGVNGVGKTTSIAKMAHLYADRLGKDKIILAAGDTFRAAAIDQLVVHGERLGVRVVRHDPGADPGAVIYDAITSAKARNAALILADTAGRMHTKSHLVEELKKIGKIVETRAGECRLRKILVLDATTGQNSVSQAEVFHEAVGIDSVILTKYDSLSKGGNLFAVCRRFGLPIAFTGVGEGYDDFRPFRTEQFLDRFLGE